MPVTADTLRLHFDYSAWASQRLMEAAAKLTSEELARDFRTSDKCVLETLVHVFAADRIWLARVQGVEGVGFISATDRDFGKLQTEWPALYQRWEEWLAPLTDEGVRVKVAYRDLKGNDYVQPLWQILLHVVNHGTHHRGQAAGFLRAMGYAPPALDLIAFYRTNT
jgi:uncharacterized damage-inducible protein DinB